MVKEIVGFFSFQAENPAWEVMGSPSANATRQVVVSVIGEFGDVDAVIGKLRKSLVEEGDESYSKFSKLYLYQKWCDV